MTDFTPIRKARQPSPFDGILEQARDLMYARLDEAVAAMLDKADEALLALINETRDRTERIVFEEAREAATQRRDVIESQFQELYLEDFQRRCNRARKIGVTFDRTEVTVDELELVGEEDLDETLKFNDMAHKLRTYCEDELQALDQRVGVLLGDADLQAKDNPFSPQVICDAFKHACRRLEVNMNVRRALLRLFDDHVLDDIRSVYKGVNAFLVRNSILPKIRFSTARNQDRKSAAGADGTPEPTSADLAAAGAPDLFSLLQKLAANNVAAMGQPGAVGGVAIPGGMPGGAPGVPGAAVLGGAGVAAGQPGGVAGAVVLQGAELLGSLTRIQRGDLSAVSGAGAGQLVSVTDPGTTNVLHQLKATSVGAGMGQLDLLTLDIIAMLFDHLFDDPKVPNGVKGIIGRLQIPMLKVAIADKSFFSTKTHPARRLLDAVGEVAMRLPADFGAESPIFEKLQAVLQEVVDGYQDDLEIFTQVREKLLVLVAEEDRRIEQQAQAEAKRVAEMETLALARSAAQMEVRTRLEANRKLPVPVRDFLARHWLKLLLLVHVKEGTTGRVWKSALELMDRLIWSVQPKTTPEDRHKLGELLPKLIKHLAVGMKSAGIEDAVRDEFFAQLMQYHAQAIGGGGRESADASVSAKAAALPRQVQTAGAVPAPAPAKPAATPESLAAALAKPVASDSLDFTQPITVKNPYGGGEVSVDAQDLDFTATIDTARAKREESIRKALDTLGIGSWVEFTDPDNPSVRRPARLIFVSPRQTRYLFAADRAGKEIIQCTRSEIGRRIRIGEVVRLDKPPEESLFERIMGGLLSKLRTPGRATALFAH